MRTTRNLVMVAFSLLVLSAVLVLAQAEEPRRDVLYTCNCGPQCKCNSAATMPGNCTCGNPMKWGHVLKIEGSQALLCTCGEGCKCSLDPKDPTKCGCGNPIKKVDLKGTGIYFCNCGGACSKGSLSVSPSRLASRWP